MKTKKIDPARLRNDEHFQFNTEFRALAETQGAALFPRIQTQFDAFLTLYAQEDEALKKIMKSAVTAEIQEADKRRDLIFRGMADAVKSALNHFRPEVKNAAKRLKILLDTFGNVARKPLNEETSAVYNLLQELKGAYAADLSTAGIADWALELEDANNALSGLMNDRYEESAQRCDLVLKEVRAQIDAAYRSIIERIDALAVIEDNEACSNFIRRWNAVVEKYSSIAAQRTGRKQ